MMKLKQLSTLSLLCLSLVVLSCSRSDRTPIDEFSGRPGPTTSTNDTLVNSKWTLSTYNRDSLIEGTRFTLSFAVDQAHGNAGCNQFFGGYSIKGNLFTFTEISMTEMACMEPDGLMQQEQTIIELLGMTERFEQTNKQLIFFSGDKQTLTFEALIE